MEFKNTYLELVTILANYEESLIIKHNSGTCYYLHCGIVPKYKKEIMFGSVVINKNYVSFHLFPVYMFPDLLQTISPELKNRMQGKSCFNFKTIENNMSAELKLLTENCFQRFLSEKIVALKK